MADIAEPLHVVIQDDSDSTRVDPVTGTIETDLPDGGVFVQLDAHRPGKDDDDNAFDANLADKIDATQLGQIAADLLDAIQADDKSRQGYLEIRSRGIKLLGLEIKPPKSLTGDVSAPIEGISNVTNPIMAESLFKSWANAQAELLPASGPVKVKDDGDETTAEDDLAAALERDMNHYLTVTAPEYRAETSHMLLWGTILGGSGIKKVYRCLMRRRPVAESVPIEDFIVSDTTKDLRACGRITHRIEMRPTTMKRMMAMGAYRDVALTQPTQQTNAVQDAIAGIQGTSISKDRPQDQPYNVFETQCELDLPEFAPTSWRKENSGVPLPFLVTIDKDSQQILAIRRDWREDDEQCERKRLYVRYPYIPGPGFYGTGMINLQGNSANALTAIWQETIDAGMFANFPGGLISELGARQNTSDMMIMPGQFRPIKTNNQPIGNVILPNPYKDVTPGLLALMDKVLAQAKSVGGAVEIPTSEGIHNVPVGTMLAAVEQATQLMMAVHKGMHDAQSEEIALIVELFRDRPEDFWRSNKVAPPNYWSEQKFLQAIDNVDLVPVSDPNVPSHLHRIMKSWALVQLYQVFGPIMNPVEVLQRILRVVREDPTNIIAAPQGQQGPSLVEQAAMMTAQAKQQEANIKAGKLQLDQQALSSDAQNEQQKLAAEMSLAKVNLAKELVIHNDDKAQDMRQHALDAQQQAHQQRMDVASHGLDVAGHGLDVAGHGLAVDQARHDAMMDLHEATQPPQPGVGKT